MTIVCVGCELSALDISRMGIALFLAICFLQSGIDKIIDRKGNLQWLVGHFANSPLKNLVPILLSTITILELVGGFLCLVGVADLILTKNSKLIFYGFSINAIAIISLFFGQRIAKDYEGASVLVNYFILTMLGILTFAFH